MQLPYIFPRRIGGVGPVPVLGTDGVPVDHTYLAQDNVFRTKISAGHPAQQVIISYHYTGAGPAPDLLAQTYVFDGTTATWYTIDALAMSLKPGDLAFVGIPQIIDRPQVAGGPAADSTIDSLEFALVVSVAGGEPDGTYTFGLGVDISSVSDQTAGGGGGGTVNQGLAGAQPWPMRVAGGLTATSAVSLDDITLVADTPTALPSHVCQLGVTVQSDPDNTAVIRMGGAGTNATHGFRLKPGQAAEFDVLNANLITLYCDVGGQVVHPVAT